MAISKPSLAVGRAPKGRWVADGVIVFVIVIWGVNNVIMKAAMQEWVSPLAFNSIRFPVGALAMLILMLVLEKDWRLPWNVFVRVAALGLLGNAINQVLFTNGLSLTTASNAGIIGAMIPILAALIGSATGLDRSSPRLWLGAVVSFGGILMVTLLGGHGFGGFRVGDLLLLGSSTAWAGYTVFSAPLTRLASPLKVTTYAMLTASVAVFLLGLPQLVHQDFSRVSAFSWGGLLFAGLLSNAAAYGLYVWVIHRIGSTRAAMFNNLSPVVTALTAWVFLGERWLGVQWAGAALVMAGVLLARWDVIVASLRRAG